MVLSNSSKWFSADWWQVYQQIQRLFFNCLCNVESIIKRLVYMVLAVTGINYYGKRYKGSKFIGYIALPILLN